MDTMEKPRGAGSCWVSSESSGSLPYTESPPGGAPGDHTCLCLSGYGKPQQLGSLAGFTLGNPFYHHNCPLAFPAVKILGPFCLLKGKATDMARIPA